MSKLVVGLTVVIALVLIQLPQCQAAHNDTTTEIESVEVIEEPKTVNQVSTNLNVDFVVSTGTAHVVATNPPPVDWGKILEQIRRMIDNLGGIGISCSFLAWRIWSFVKGLRRGRPRDYHKFTLQLRYLFSHISHI